VIVYVDIILMYNIAINIVVLFLSTHLIKYPLSLFTMFISIITCSFISVLTLLYASMTIQNIIKLISPAVICTIITKNVTLRQHIKLIITYHIFSFVLSGIMQSTKYSLNSLESCTITLLSVLIAVILFIKSYKTATHFFVNQFKSHSNNYEITIYHNGKCLKLLGYNDSGNTLVYNIDNIPIFISDYETLKQILTNENEKYELIECSTILKKSYIKVFEPDSIYISGKKAQAKIGISNIPLKTDFDIIINIDNVRFSETETNYA